MVNKFIKPTILLKIGAKKISFKWINLLTKKDFNDIKNLKVTDCFNGHIFKT